MNQFLISSTGCVATVREAQPLCGCPARMCPNLHFLVKVHRDLMAPGNPVRDPHPPLAMGPGTPAQVRWHHPALPYVRPSLQAPCLQPGLRSFLDGPWTHTARGFNSSPASSPIFCCSQMDHGWTLHLAQPGPCQACHWSLLPAPSSAGPDQTPGNGIPSRAWRAMGHLSSARLIEQPHWHRREGVGERAEAEIIRMKRV